MQCHKNIILWKTKKLNHNKRKYSSMKEFYGIKNKQKINLTVKCLHTLRKPIEEQWYSYVHSSVRHWIQLSGY